MLAVCTVPVIPTMGLKLKCVHTGVYKTTHHATLNPQVYQDILNDSHFSNLGRRHFPGVESPTLR